LQQSEYIPYGITMVQADQVWDQGVTGSGVKVCVIDTGIDQDHEDFVTDRLTGLESSSNPWQRDRVGHGTHCSGTIAAARNNGGVVGVAPDAEIYTVRAFGDRGGWIYASGLLDAVYQCQAAGAKIVSMSLGGVGYSDSENLAYRMLFEEGVLLIAAATAPNSCIPRVSMALYPSLLLTAIRP
jgi:serine protease